MFGGNESGPSSQSTLFQCACMPHSFNNSLESTGFKKQAILWILRSHRESIIKQIFAATVTATEGGEINQIKDNDDFAMIDETSLPFVPIVLKIDLILLFQRDIQFANHLLKKFNTSHKIISDILPKLVSSKFFQRLPEKSRRKSFHLTLRFSTFGPPVRRITGRMTGCNIVISGVIQKVFPASHFFYSSASVSRIEMSCQVLKVQITIFCGNLNACHAVSPNNKFLEPL
mmetsp:Transcript_25460/g.40828  ORF Transcript_25460/g.40828 Transcript_25460/m.40828 type:complete len:230 (-) Transcript_25460:1560-2249(-)